MLPVGEQSIVERRAKQKMNEFHKYSNLLLGILLISTLLTATLGESHYRTLEDVKHEREKLVKKYFKTLKKEEGAIKLVGGKHDHEGEKMCGGIQLAALQGNIF
jgi:hypothetical protein